MFCQKCRAPLKLDSSLEDLNPTAFDLLVGASVNGQPKNIPPSRSPYLQERKQLYDRVSQNATSPTIKRKITSPRRRDVPESVRGGLGNPAMSFVMLTESQVVAPSTSNSSESTNPKHKKLENCEHNGANEEVKTMSQDIDRASRLFEILSARSDIDHPICVECTELLVSGLQKRLEAVTRERDAYVRFLKQINADLPTEEEIKESQEALAKARADEQLAIEDLKKLEAEKEAVDDEIAILEEEARTLDLEEQRFWSERNDFNMNLAEFQNVCDSITQQYNHDSQLLEKLQRTNVYNDTFCISHDGNFGTINGLRLGRLSNVPVDWSEINAAWGHTVLLLQTVAGRLGYKFQGYELQPMGSTSRIFRYENPSTSNLRSGSKRVSITRTPKISILELFSSGDMPLGLTFMHRHFDTAMVAFLECMRQLGAYVETETAKTSDNRVGLVLPYKIDCDKIGDVSIKLGIAQDDAWSRACKFTLTCCKFLLAHASNVNAAQGRRTL